MSLQPPTGTEAESLDEIEVVTGEVVDADVMPVVHVPGSEAAVALGDPVRARTGRLATLGGAPAVVQVVAVAATGIVAGAATTALVRAARGRKSAAVRRGPSRPGPGGVEVVETRTYVVDVHLVGRR